MNSHSSLNFSTMNGLQKEHQARLAREELHRAKYFGMDHEFYPGADMRSSSQLSPMSQMQFSQYADRSGYIMSPTQSQGMLYNQQKVNQGYQRAGVFPAQVLGNQHPMTQANPYLTPNNSMTPNYSAAVSRGSTNTGVNGMYRNRSNWS